MPGGCSQLGAGPRARGRVQTQLQPCPGLSLQLIERAIPFQALDLLDSFLSCEISIARFTDKKTGASGNLM